MGAACFSVSSASRSSFALYTHPARAGSRRGPLYANTPDAPDRLAAAMAFPLTPPAPRRSRYRPWEPPAAHRQQRARAPKPGFPAALAPARDTLRYWCWPRADDAASLHGDNNAAGSRAPSRCLESDALGPTHLSPAQLGGGTRRVVLLTLAVPSSAPAAVGGLGCIAMTKSDRPLPRAGATDRPTPSSSSVSSSPAKRRKPPCQPHARCVCRSLVAALGGRSGDRGTGLCRLHRPRHRTVGTARPADMPTRITSLLEFETSAPPPCKLDRVDLDAGNRFQSFTLAATNTRSTSMTACDVSSTTAA